MIKVSSASSKKKNNKKKSKENSNKRDTAKNKKKAVDSSTSKKGTKTKAIKNKNDDEVIVKELEDSENKFVYYLMLVITIISILFISFVIFLYIQHKDTNVYKGVIFYKYQYKEGNITYNLEFRYPPQELAKNLSMIPEVKYNLENTVNVTFSFGKYKLRDNANISVAAVSLAQIVKTILHTSVKATNLSQFNCSTANRLNKVITFNPYAKKDVVYWETPYCLRINGTSSGDIVYLSNLVIYKILNE